MMNHKLSILAAAVSLALAAGAAAQSAGETPTRQPVTTPPVTTPPDTTPPVDTQTDPMNRTTTRPTTLRPQSAEQADLITERERQGQAVGIAARQQRVFDQLDRDGDGFLATIDAPVESELRSGFERFDSDDDGRLSRTEFAAFVRSEGDDALAALDTAGATSDTTAAATTDDTPAGARTPTTAGAASTAGTPTTTGTPATAGTGAAAGTPDAVREQRLFQQLDEDDSGALARAELPSRSLLARNFDRWDRNGDAQLSRMEFNAYAREQGLDGLAVLIVDVAPGTEAAVAGTAPAPTRTPATTAPLANESARAQQLFQQLDDDNDGQLARVDLPVDSELRSDFLRWDSNNDGRLSRSEFDVFVSQSGAEAVAALSIDVDVEDEPASPAVAPTAVASAPTPRTNTLGTAADTGTAVGTTGGTTAGTTAGITAGTTADASADAPPGTTAGTTVGVTGPGTTPSTPAEAGLSSDRASEADEAGGGGAQPGSTVSDFARQQRVFDRLDTTSNGFLSLMDLPRTSSLRQQFDRWDNDDDGLISRLEFGAWARQQGPQALARLEQQSEADTQAGVTRRSDVGAAAAATSGAQADRGSDREAPQQDRSERADQAQDRRSARVITGTGDESSDTLGRTAGTTGDTTAFGGTGGRGTVSGTTAATRGTVGTAATMAVPENSTDVLDPDLVVVEEMHTFTDLDDNQDGFIYRRDVLVDAELAQQFDEYDLDGDGRLSRAEFDALVAGTDPLQDDQAALTQRDIDDEER